MNNLKVYLPWGWVDRCPIGKLIQLTPINPGNSTTSFRIPEVKFQKFQVTFQTFRSHSRSNSRHSFCILDLRSGQICIECDPQGQVLDDPEFSHLGSTPDRIPFCRCCGKRMVEVKSLYSNISIMPHIAAAEYIYKENGTYKLQKETKRNYQIQGKMAFSKVTNADLAIYKQRNFDYMSSVWQAFMGRNAC